MDFFMQKNLGLHVKQPRYFLVQDTIADEEKKHKEEVTKMNKFEKETYFKLLQQRKK